MYTSKIQLLVERGRERDFTALTHACYTQLGKYNNNNNNNNNK